jgi:hypothetical protein
LQRTFQEPERVIEDLYRLTLDALRHHALAAGAQVSDDEGDLIVAGHRLGISIAFEGCVEQGDLTLAPLEVQLHVDEVGEDRFRVGMLGIARDCRGAMQGAVEEWFLLAGQPVLAALGASQSAPGRHAEAFRLARWEGFAGRTAVRGSMPDSLAPGGALYRDLLSVISQTVEHWEPEPNSLRSIFLMLTWAEGGMDVQTAVDGILDADLVTAVGALNWPHTTAAYLFKQFFVFRPRTN